MTTSFAPMAPASVTAGARELVAGLHETLWAAKSPREMLDAVAELERLKSEMAAIEAQVLPPVRLDPEQKRVRERQPRT